MKFVSYFADFLTDTVNLNQSRIDLLDNSVNAIKDFIRQSEWKSKFKSFVHVGIGLPAPAIYPVPYYAPPPCYAYGPYACPR